MESVLVVWIAIVATAAIIVFGAVVPSLFVRPRSKGSGYRRSTRTSRAWAELAVCTIGLLIVVVVSVILSHQITATLANYWVWSVPVFFILSAVFVGWFFSNAGYRTDTALLSVLLFLGVATGFVAYLVQPFPWPPGHLGIL